MRQQRCFIKYVAFSVNNFRKNENNSNVPLRGGVKRKSVNPNDPVPDQWSKKRKNESEPESAEESEQPEPEQEPAEQEPAEQEPESEPAESAEQEPEQPEPEQELRLIKD